MSFRDALKFRGVPSRRPTEDDVDGWFSAAALQKPPRERDVAVLRERIARMHPGRWSRLQRDFHWFQRQCQKMGMNPEDARWLL